ncbi:MAG: 23S rRNA (pseudouridine(1915)-N(3))-methyltransferase RlmH [Campylobacterales bacterium]
MRISLWCIGKKEPFYSEIAADLSKMIGRFARFEANDLFPKEVALAQQSGEQEARAAYTKLLRPKMAGMNIALDPAGQELDSHAFAQMLEKSAGQITFFIGGAYGFERSFLGEMDKIVSLSKMTMSHRIAKVVLLEQIYRALTILNHHPYHK